MSKLVAVLKDEIRRLARKEVRAQTITTKRAAVAHRHDIARLKRLIQSFQKQVEHLASQISQQAGDRGGAERDEGSPNRFSARSVRAQRRRLKLSAADYGRLVGVTGQTIYQWEQGKSRPRKSQFGALIAVRSIGRRAALERIAGAATGGRKPRRKVRKQ